MDSLVLVDLVGNLAVEIRSCSLLELQKSLVHLCPHAGNLPTSILHDSSLCMQAWLIWNQVLQQAENHLQQCQHQVFVHKAVFWFLQIDFQT